MRNRGRNDLDEGTMKLNGFMLVKCTALSTLGTLKLLQREPLPARVAVEFHIDLFFPSINCTSSGST